MINQKEENQFKQEDRQQLESTDTIDAKEPMIIQDQSSGQPIIGQGSEISQKNKKSSISDKQGKQVFYLVESPDKPYIKTLDQILTIELLPTQDLLTQHKFFIDMMNLKNDKLQNSQKEMVGQLERIKAENTRLQVENLNLVKVEKQNQELIEQIRQLNLKDSIQQEQTQDKQQNQKSQSKQLNDKIIQLEAENSCLIKKDLNKQKLMNQNSELNQIIDQLQLEDRQMLQETSENQLQQKDHNQELNNRINQLLLQNSTMNKESQSHKLLELKNKELQEQVDLLQQENNILKEDKKNSDYLKDSNDHLLEMIKQSQTKSSSQQHEVQSDIQSSKSEEDIVVLKLILADKEKISLENLEKNSAVFKLFDQQKKDKELVELQIILQNRVKKVVELEEKIDDMKDQQKRDEKLYTPDNQNFYKELLIQRDKFDQLSLLYQQAIASQQQIISQQQINQKKMEQKNQRISKLELQNLDLRRLQQVNSGLNFQEQLEKDDSDEKTDKDDQKSDEKIKSSPPIHEKDQTKNDEMIIKTSPPQGQGEYSLDDQLKGPIKQSHLKIPEDI